MMQLRPKLRNAAVPLAAISLLALGWTIGVTRAQDKAATANEEAQAEFAKIRGAVFGTVDKPDAHPSVADIDRLMAQYVKASRDPKLLEVVTLDALADQKQGKFGSIELQILQTMQNQRIIALLEQMAAKPGGAATRATELPTATADIGVGGNLINTTIGKFVVAGRREYSSYAGGSSRGGYPGSARFNGGVVAVRPAANAASEPEQGYTQGRVTALGDGWIEVTTGTGVSLRFIHGAPDVAQALRDAPGSVVVERAGHVILGDTVKVFWTLDGGVRFDAIALSR